MAGEDAKKDPKWWADLRTASHFLMEAKKRHGQEITMTMAPAIVVCETRRLNEKQLDIAGPKDATTPHPALLKSGRIWSIPCRSLAKLSRSVGEYITDVIDNGIGKFLLFAHHKDPRAEREADRSCSFYIIKGLKSRSR